MTLGILSIVTHFPNPMSAPRPLSALSSTHTAQSKPHWLYLPGMDGTGDLFDKQRPDLEGYFQIHSLRLNDALARMPASDHPESWDLLVEIAAEQLQPETVVCGESFGACLGMLLALRYPERCRGLVLVNPASSFRRGAWWINARHLLHWIPEGIFQVSSERGLGWLAELSQMSAMSRNQLMAAVRSVSTKVAAQRLALLHQFDPDPLPLETLNLPTLFVAGGHDRLLPSIAESRHLATRIPQSEVVISPQSGHACLMERDLKLEDLIRQHCPALLPTAGIPA